MNSIKFSELDTGDIVLFSYNNFASSISVFTSLIKYFTNSEYTHCAVIVKNPHFIDNGDNDIYLWESGWNGRPDLEDGELKFGIQLTHAKTYLKNYDGKLFARKLISNNSPFDDSNLKRLQLKVYNKGYELNPLNWYYAIWRNDKYHKNTDRFWCSSFLAYMFLEFKMISDVNWSIVRPSDFSSRYKNGYINFNDGIVYSDDKDLIID